MAAQMISTTSRGSQKSHQLVDAASQARIVLDRIGYDLSFMPQRKDMHYLFENKSEGNVLQFISQVNAVEGNRGVSLVGYEIRPDSQNKRSLYRGVHGYNWEDSRFFGITSKEVPVSLAHLPRELNLTESDYDVLSEGVFKIALSFQKKSDGKLYSKMPTYEVNGISVPAITNLAALVVGIALVDLPTRQIVTDEQLETISSRLGEIPDGTSPLVLWHQQIHEDYKKFSQDLPPVIAQSVRLFQRFYMME